MKSLTKKNRKMVFSNRKERTKNIVDKWDNISEKFSERFKLMHVKKNKVKKESYLYDSWKLKGCILAESMFYSDNYNIKLIASVFAEDHRDHHAKGEVNVVCTYTIGVFIKDNTTNEKIDKWQSIENDEEIDFIKEIINSFK